MECPKDNMPVMPKIRSCLLYTSDAADERSSVDLGGRRIIKKKTIYYHEGHGIEEIKNNEQMRDEKNWTKKKTKER